MAEPEGKQSLNSSAYMAMAMIGGGATTGYAIKQGLERVAVFFWSASYGQIYPDLRKLEAAGLIVGADRASGGRQRREYSLTDEGRAELQRWLAEPTEPGIWIRHEGIMRMMLVDWDDRELALKNLAELRQASADRLASVIELQPPLERGIRIKNLGERILRETIAWCDETEKTLRRDHLKGSDPLGSGQPAQGRSAGGRSVFRGLMGRGMAFRIVLASALVAGVVAAPAQARVPDDFYGVVAQGPLLPSDYDLMAEGGAGTLRFPIEWAQVEPEPGVYDFAAIDAIVDGAASRGIEPLPFVWSTPAWVDPQKSRPPLDNAKDERAWQRFLAVLADRYGESIDDWQVWNEANFKLYWKPKPSPRDYAELVRISAKTLREHDRGARIMLAGVAPVKRGMLPWEFLEGIYRVRGVERWFETVAVHPYHPELAGVEFQIRQALDEIDAAGDRQAKLRITELGWASEGPESDPMTKGREGQATMLDKSFELLTKERRRWKLTGVDWHSFQDVGPDGGEPVCSFCPGSGLVTAAREPKPAFDAFGRFARR